MEQKHEDSARVLFIPFDSPRVRAEAAVDSGERLGPGDLFGDTTSIYPFSSPKMFSGHSLWFTHSPLLSIWGRGRFFPPQVRASLQKAALLVRHGLNEVRPWARGHSWRERAPGLVSNIPVNPIPPGCSVHKVLRNSGMTPPRDNLKTQVFSLHNSKTLMPVC